MKKMLIKGLMLATLLGASQFHAYAGDEAITLLKTLNGLTLASIFEKDKDNDTIKMSNDTAKILTNNTIMHATLQPLVANLVAAKFGFAAVVAILTHKADTTKSAELLTLLGITNNTNNTNNTKVIASVNNFDLNTIKTALVTQATTLLGNSTIYTKKLSDIFSTAANQVVADENVVAKALDDVCKQLISVRNVILGVYDHVKTAKAQGLTLTNLFTGNNFNGKTFADYIKDIIQNIADDLATMINVEIDKAITTLEAKKKLDASSYSTAIKTVGGFFSNILVTAASALQN